MITFTVPAIPIATPRPKAAILHGHATVYGAKKSHKIHSFKATMAMAAKEAYQGPPLDGPLALTFIAVLPRPSNMRWKTRPQPRKYHERKPDFDNLLKSVDALTKILWRDDSQISKVSFEKHIAAGDEQPHVVVTVERLT